ncbi:Phosphate-specific transport system accessory protein PhoU [subsurface metagenome]
MTSVDFEKKLKQLEQNVLSLGNMVERAIDRSVQGLRKRDLALARQIIECDQELDHKRFAVQEDCMRLITTAHPEGSDLRTIIAVLGIITELERMGDYAEGIANITLMIGDQPPLKPLVDIPRMAQKGIEMLRGSLESFLDRDVEKAKRICREDDEVDALYDQVFRELLLFMVEDPKTITRATWLIWVAHNLERFADRVTNICEQVVFSATGKMVDIGSSKY